MPFLGRFEHTIDAKGRVAIPATYREELARGSADKVIIAPYYSKETPVLWVFPPKIWEGIVQARIANRSPFDPDVIQFKRGIVQRTSSCSLDSNGRILIPTELRNFAGLERDVVLAAMDDWFEIWNAELYRTLQGGGDDGGVAIDPKLWENL